MSAGESQWESDGASQPHLGNEGGRRRITRLLIANRGEIAVRIARTCRARGVEVVAVASEADAFALHTRVADSVVVLGPAAATESYLRPELILKAAADSGADAIHPGYGFLSENEAFARAVIDAGLIWVGPNPDAIGAMGSKVAARKRMEAAGVPVVPGFHGSEDADILSQQADIIGYPILVKASSGGGGKGMRAVFAAAELSEAIASATREAISAFGDGTVYIEKLLIEPRHVEIQVFGDKHGRVVSLAERECSIQRRHQKIVEESPSPAMTPDLRARMGAAAVAAAQAVHYEGAGTIEFMLDADGNFYFLEMNTRLQVEHPVTEGVLGLDLVAAQLDVAEGAPLTWDAAALTPRGYAIEVRLYAEDPAQGFLPSIGTLVRYRPPEGPGIRHDGGVSEGEQVSPHYDPMLAKLIVTGATRDAAIDRMVAALDQWEVHGVVTNRPFLRAVVDHPAFRSGATHTGFLDAHFEDGRMAAEAPDDLTWIAVAVADLLGNTGGTAAMHASDAGDGDRVSPWHTLGPFRGPQGGRA